MSNPLALLPATVGDLVALAVDQARLRSSDPLEVARISSRTVMRALRSAGPGSQSAVTTWSPWTTGRVATMSW